VSVGLSIIVVFLLIWALLRAQGPDSGKSQAQEAPPSSYGLSVPLKRKVSLFRSPAEALPDDLRRIMRKPRHGTDWSLAQRLPTSVWRVWAVPGRTTLCLLDQQKKETAVGEVCSPIKKALAIGILSAGLKEFGNGRADRAVVGLVSDGVSEVVVETHGYPDVRVPVWRNVYGLEDQIPEPPDGVRLIYRRVPS
jgi:hypothetical protein